MKKILTLRLLLAAISLGMYILHTPVSAGKAGSSQKVEKAEAVTPAPSIEDIEALVEEKITQLRSESAKTMGNDASLIRGEKLYDGACAGCHGVAGDGNGVAGQYLNPRPRDFTKGVYRFRSTATGELPTDEDLYDVIARGVDGTMMPDFAPILNEKEIKDVVAYTKSFSLDFAEYGAGEPLAIPEPVAYTDESAQEGKFFYMLQGCWTCHGKTGKGDGPSASTQKDAQGNLVPPLNFVNAIYKMGSDSKSIYKSLNTGFDGSPMASYKDLFLFANDAIDLKPLAEGYTESEIQELKEFLKTQPDQSKLDGLTQEVKDQTAEKRKWAVIHYIQSLRKEPGFFSKLFSINTDITLSR